jgi:hypothetical protein
MQQCLKQKEKLHSRSASLSVLCTEWDNYLATARQVELFSQRIEAFGGDSEGGC